MLLRGTQLVLKNRFQLLILSQKYGQKPARFKINQVPDCHSMSIYFTTAQALIKELALAEKEGVLVDKLALFSRLQLIIIDEMGYTPISNHGVNFD